MRVKPDIAKGQTLWQKVMLSCPYINSVYSAIIVLDACGYSVKQIIRFNGFISFTGVIGFHGFHDMVNQYMTTT